ncbi:hypothetical protein BC936DRAFT_148417 [Jimgerdemannia flammicorona]|uniref:Methyltransferase domain-containing protein n=1 Tax=Jimgerdemannia flammicorona TaxID=994334 RepID=A0A433DKG9_9FUNG|nr:hypothetical protein BC936DRAFT_148417 [Jimgerdemannia flammicorona]
MPNRNLERLTVGVHRPLRALQKAPDCTVNAHLRINQPTNEPVIWSILSANAMGHRHSHLRVYEGQGEPQWSQRFRTVRRPYSSVRNLAHRFQNEADPVNIAAELKEWQQVGTGKRQFVSSTSTLPIHLADGGRRGLNDVASWNLKATRAVQEEKSLKTKRSLNALDERRFGRTDSGTAESILPLEVLEADRVQKRHYAMKRLFKSNFQAPVTGILNGDNGEPAMVLEVMCGQGTWSLDMAKDFSTTMFFGVHSSRMYPTTGFPANCFFQEGTPLESRGLPFCDNTFDYVLQRFTLTSLTPEQRIRNLQELVRVAKPGGFIEVVEAEVPSIRSGPANWVSPTAIAEFRNSIEIDDASPEAYDELERQCLGNYQTVAEYDIAYGRKSKTQREE